MGAKQTASVPTRTRTRLTDVVTKSTAILAIKGLPGRWSPAVSFITSRPWSVSAARERGSGGGSGQGGARERWPVPASGSGARGGRGRRHHLAHRGCRGHQRNEADQEQRGDGVDQGR